jgi:hypothetical protein
VDFAGAKMKRIKKKKKTFYAFRRSVALQRWLGSFMSAFAMKSLNSFENLRGSFSKVLVHL